MGKGYQNFMCKKFFHPTSFENIKRKWMAEQKHEFEQKKQQELMDQYKREQDLLNNRAMLGDKKAQLGLTFLYDPPPGVKQEGEDEIQEKSVKFEWQRKYTAPRESYNKAKNDDDSSAIPDQPFGIEVKNVRCIKCHQWGHVNTDKTCPLFGRNLTAEPPPPGSNPTEMMQRVREQMKEDGILMKTSVWDHELDESKPNQRVLPHIDENDPEVQFLKSLSPEEKAKLLRKLEKYDKKKNEGKISSSFSTKKIKKEKRVEKGKRETKDRKRRKRHYSESDNTNSDTSSSGYSSRKQSNGKQKHRVDDHSSRLNHPRVKRERSSEEKRSDYSSHNRHADRNGHHNRHDDERKYRDYEISSTHVKRERHDSQDNNRSSYSSSRYHERIDRDSYEHDDDRHKRRDKSHHKRSRASDFM